MSEDEPRPRNSFQPAPLADWAEADLRAYISDLTAEITRAQTAIATRAHQRAAADAFFRMPGEGEKGEA